MGLTYDPLAPPDWQNPYPTYRALRDQAPVYFAEGTGVYCVSRHEDVVRVLRDPESFSSASAFDVLIEDRFKKIRARELRELIRFLYRSRINPLKMRRGRPDMLIACDPPRHDELRNIVNRGFTPRRIKSWEGRLRSIVADCMTKLGRGEVFDVIHDLAIPVPVTVIAEMLGIDPARIDDFKRWSDAIIAGSSGSGRDSLAPFLAAMGELNAYMREVAIERRKHPAEDLMSILVDDSNGAALDNLAVGQFVLLLLVAGNETTTNLIGNAVKALLENPDQLERVVSDPSLVPSLIEESLRYDGPVQFVFRKATKDTEVAGETIPANARVAVLLGSANRDERVFPDPDQFDITRNAKGHVGFGLGVHFCLGASLARLEATCVFEALLPELPRLTYREPTQTFVDSTLVRGLEKLELVARA